MEESDLVALVEFMAKSLVDRPEEVEVEVRKNENTNEFIIKVAKGDLGKVIGKSGRTVDAMRVIFAATSSKMKLGRCVLKVDD